MLFAIVIVLIAGYTLVYAGLAKGGYYKHPWQLIIEGLGQG